MTMIRLATAGVIVGMLAACAPPQIHRTPTPQPAPTPFPPQPEKQQPAAKEQPPETHQPSLPRPTKPPEQTGEKVEGKPARKPEETPTHPAPSVPRTAKEASGAAVTALLQQGERLAKAGKYKQASAAIERALNIEPRNPFVYQRLAALRLQQGRPHQAEALARKSNSLGQNNPYLQADNWALIARSLQAQGKPLAAESAAGQADYLRGRTR